MSDLVEKHESELKKFEEAKVISSVYRANNDFEQQSEEDKNKII